jgi:ketosteroid isomerase-like protein
MPAQREEDEAEIRQQVDKIVAGIRARDLEGLKRLYATDVVSFDVEPPLQHVGIEAKLKNWAKAFTFFQDVDYEVRDLTITVGDDWHSGTLLGSRHAEGRTATTDVVRAPSASGSSTALADRARPGFMCRSIIASGKGVTDLEP